MRAKYLRMLEEERFDQLPGHTYTKGFLRVYADSLGLDGRLYVDEYNSRFVAGDEDNADAPRAAPSAPRAAAAQRVAYRRRHPAAIAVLTALVIAAWRFGGHERPRWKASTRPTGVGANRVTVSVRAVHGPSFVEVRAGSPSGAPLFTGTLERGQMQRFTPKALYLYVEGRATSS